MTLPSRCRCFQGVAISIGIVITFILFHELSLGGEGAVTGSSIIESEKHIVHMYKAVGDFAPLVIYQFNFATD